MQTGNSSEARVLRSLRRFGRDEGGQISFIGIFGAVAFVSLLGLVMTTGDQVSSKMEMQDAVDAAALSGGAWIARGLNVTSAFNVMETQLVGGAILLNALADTLQWSRPIVLLQYLGYKACMGTVLGAAICIIPYLVTKAQLFALDRLIPLVNRLAEKLSRCDDGLFWRVAEALEQVNGAVRASFYGIALAEAWAVGVENGARFALLIPGPAFYGDLSKETLMLPTREAAFENHCDPMERGSPARRQRGYHLLLGYPVGKGPYSLGLRRLKPISSLVTGFPPVGWFLLPSLADAQKAMLCRGAVWQGLDITLETAVSLEECEALGGTVEWRRTTLRSILFDEPLDDPEAFFDSKLPSPPPGASEEEIDAMLERLDNDPELVHPIERVTLSSLSCSWRPRGGLRQLSERRELVSSDPVDYDYGYTLVIYTPGVARVSRNEEHPANPAGGVCSRKPSSYLLVEENDALRYLAVAYRPNRRIFFRRIGRRFEGDGAVASRGLWAHPLEDPPGLLTYAQVEIYNGTSPDTYTQDWRVRLDDASLIDQPFAGLFGSLAEMADGLPYVGDFLDRLAGEDPDDRFWEINNH